jgi:hypothetical protein
LYTRKGVPKENIRNAEEYLFARQKWGKVSDLGRMGELKVRELYDIGPKGGPGGRIDSINGLAEFRVPGGINRREGTISEIKNVGKQDWTDQLDDYAAYAQQKGLKFNLYLRKDAEVLPSLQDAVDKSEGVLKIIRVAMD